MHFSLSMFKGSVGLFIGILTYSFLYYSRVAIEKPPLVFFPQPLIKNFQGFDNHVYQYFKPTNKDILH